METKKSLACWNCKQTIENVGMNCPHCNVFIDKEMIDRISEGEPLKIASGGLYPGTVLDERYEIIKPLGRGGMGIVYKAQDKYMDRVVALKLIPKELSMDPKAIADLKRETALALDLTHEHIVRLYNLDTWESHTFVSMEYVQCGTLSHLMVEKGGCLPFEEALPLLRQIGQALDYAHSKNPPVVHLDLKPLNILLTVDGYAKIGDFGLARVLRDLATRVSAWEAAGSLAYMSPEQIRGKGIGTWTDIYAFAAVAYELLSGQPPFYTGDLRWQIMHEAVDPIEGMPDHVNRALLIALSKDSARRPKTAGEFVKMIANEMPVPDFDKPAAAGKTAAEKEADTVPADAAPETEESLFWKEEWFQHYEEKPERTAPDSAKKPVLMYGIIVFLCLLVLGELGWIIYSQNGEVARRVNALLQPKTMEPRKPPPAVAEADRVAKIMPETEIPIPKKEEPAAVATGGLSLATQPPGAVIQVDDQDQLTAPAVLDKLPEGPHRVTVSKEGFQVWNGEITVQAAKVMEVQIDLTPVSGTVSVKSQPEDAQVFLNGELAGVTPFILDQGVTGEQVVEIRKPGYKTWKKTVTVPPGETLEVSATLAPLPRKLQVTSSPQAADVYMAGDLIGKTPVTLESIQDDKVVVEVRKSCYESVKRTISLSPGKETREKFVLKPACGEVAVSSLPEGADWFLNGKLMGKTPGTVKSLEKGIYTIRVARERYADWEKQVNIKPRKNKPIIATLDPLAELDENLYIDPVTEMEFVWVDKGCFQMGSPMDEKDAGSDENPVHEICLDGFWMGKYEVTQWQWVKVVGENPSSFQNGTDYPVENVSWEDTRMFFSRLNEMNKGKATYRLPTEAEWEYACRSGGKPEKYAGGDDPNPVAWFKDNSMGATHAVGNKKPNGLGLFDMSGNVFEWVEDVYQADAYLRHQPSNPFYKGEGKYRVCRGGSWSMGSKESRCANRSFYFPTSRNYNLGFRVVKNP